MKSQTAPDDLNKNEGAAEQPSLYSDSRRILSSFLLTLLAALITLPLFIIAYRFVPDIILPVGNGFRIDHILAFILIFTLIRILLQFIRNFVFGLMIFLLLGMTVGQISGRFGFTHLYTQYVDLITYFGSNPVKIPFLREEKKSIPNEDIIRKAITYNRPDVREFAVKSSLKYFSKIRTDYKYRHLVKYFSVFRVMSAWEYVPDPRGEDYIAPAEESIRLMSGDCDDYSVLMAACVKATGGEVRLIRTVDHLYPEVKIGTMDDLPAVIHLIKNQLFYKESLGERIFYHEDQWGNIWLNFDYTNTYPGGRFMSEEIIGIMDV